MISAIDDQDLVCAENYTVNVVTPDIDFDFFVNGVNVGTTVTLPIEESTLFQTVTNVCLAK